jgi:predicted RNase H-like HicB family nuclease
LRNQSVASSGRLDGLEDTVIGCAVVSERSTNNYGAWVPDLDGCVPTGNTLDEMKTYVAKVIQIHLESFREHEEPVPPPVAKVTVVPVAS